MELPAWIGPNRPLWSNLFELEQYVRKSWQLSDKPVSLVAVTSPDNSTLAGGEWPYLQETRPFEVDDSWTLLGYDALANQSTLSGLMDCGYSSSERASMQGQFGHPSFSQIIYSVGPQMQLAFASGATRLCLNMLRFSLLAYT